MPGTQAYWGAAAAGGAPLAEGTTAVAKMFVGRARAARAAYIGDEPAAVWVHEGRPLVVFRFAIAGDRIVRIDLVGDPDTLQRVVPE
jgi:RNA polymerase sigma-70 factor (ECF subfamily)